MNIQDLLIFLIPLVVVQFILLIYTLIDISKQTHFQRFDQKTWFIIALVGMNYIGPILYFVFGRER